MQEKILALNVFIALLKEPPNDDLLKTFSDEKLWEDWLCLRDSTTQEKALNLLQNTKENANEIGADFTSLFISDVDFVKAPLYASFYLSKDKEIYSSNSDSIKNLYIKNAFKDFDMSNPADFLLNELAFIQFLFLHNKQEILKEFLQDEFLTWFYAWNEDFQKGAKTQFYQAISLLIKDFFDELTQNLALKPKDRKIY